MRQYGWVSKGIQTAECTVYVQNGKKIGELKGAEFSKKLFI